MVINRGIIISVIATGSLAWSLGVAQADAGAPAQQPQALVSDRFDGMTLDDNGNS
ncbi:hypothetical protein [Streptomyces marincola]|uniref:hypothetical protein n=1 Tax=Streptomyces marincola TaxID=2878388 RepID=UPI00131E1B7E|nr:hypothetical protein [Streptomyces marincola]